jgi:MFS family permease
MTVAGLWTVTWVALGVAGRVDSALGGAIFVSSFALFALGETMYAPVLNQLITELAPAGQVGTTLGLFAALQTGFSAAGPMLAGLLLSGGTGGWFVAVHLGFALSAVLAADRLRRGLLLNASSRVASLT